MSWNLPKLSQLWRCNGGFGPCTAQNHLRTKQFVSGTWNSSTVAACALRNEEAGRGRWPTYHPCSSETSKKSGALIYPEPLGPPRPVAGDLYFILLCYTDSVSIGTFTLMLQSFSHITQGSHWGDILEEYDTTFLPAGPKGSFTLQAEPSRTEPNRFGLENKPTLWNGSIHTARRTEPNRTGPSLTERVHWLMFVFSRQPTTDSVAQ